jgi:hypothetical protein
LLTQGHIDRLGPSLQHVWPVDEAPCFSGLLEAIDQAERKLWRDRDRKAKAGMSAAE